MESKWEPTEEHLKKFGINDLKFIFSQAEKLFKETITISDLIISRTSILLTVTIGVISALVGFLIKRGVIDEIMVVGVFLFFYLYSIGFLLYLNLRGHKYSLLGSLPKDFFDDYYFKEEFTDSEREKELIITEIISYNERIELNKAKNEKRWNLYSKAIKMIILTPVFLIIIYTGIKILKYSICDC